MRTDRRRPPSRAERLDAVLHELRRLAHLHAEQRGEVPVGLRQAIGELRHRPPAVGHRIAGPHAHR
jgi:hypothetical protein